jgi:ribose 5-phosphate isomerase
VALVKSGMVIGLGTGRTLTLVIEEIGKLIQEGKVYISSPKLLIWRRK